jgi:hypothetical protein
MWLLSDAKATIVPNLAVAIAAPAPVKQGWTRWNSPVTLRDSLRKSRKGGKVFAEHERWCHLRSFLKPFGGLHGQTDCP